MKVPSRLRAKVSRLSVIGVAVGSLVGGFTLLAGVSPAGASGNLYVATTGTDAANTCTVASNPCATLTHAYNQAGGGTTTINLSGGTFITKNLEITKNINIVGVLPNGSLDVLTTTISGNGNQYALHIHGAVVKITNVVINDASAEAIWNDTGSTLTLTNVTVGASVGSVATIGAGIANIGTLTMDGGSLIGNTATIDNTGGGLVNGDYVAIPATATLHSVSITHNTAAEGGGIMNLLGTVHLTGTTSLHNNVATAAGGGIEECPVGTTLTTQSSVVNTSNSPDQINHTDPAGLCP